MAWIGGALGLGALGLVVKKLVSSKSSGESNLKPKLVYFKLRGRAEPVRIILHLNGVKFDDERLAFGEEFASFKSTTGDAVVFGQAPYLKIDGIELVQSNAILRYLGGRFGMAGADLKERAQCDIIVDGVEDLMVKALTAWFSKEKAVTVKDFLSTVVPKWLAFFEQALVRNGRKGVFVGNSLTYADVSFFHIMDQLIETFSMEHDALKKDFPLCVGVIDKIAGSNGVKEYLATRPKSDV